MLKQLQRSHLWSVEAVDGGERGSFRGLREVFKKGAFQEVKMGRLKHTHTNTHTVVNNNMQGTVGSGVEAGFTW